MNVQVETKGETVRVFNVEVPHEDVDRQFASATKAYQRQAVLPGFRKGRVPEDLVAKKFAREIREEVMERLVSSSYHRILAEHHIVPIEAPRLENLTLDRGKPLTYQMTVEVLPNVKLGEYRGLKLKKPKVDIQEGQVLEVLERLRRQNAVLVPVEDRGAQAGDLVTLDFQGFRDGQEVAQAKAEGVQAEIGSGQLLPGFDEGLLDARPGEHRTFPVRFPEDFGAKDLAGSELEFSVEVRALQSRRVEDLDDAFARSMGDFEDLASLKARIRQDLAAHEERQHDGLLREQILQHLAKSVKVQVPDVLIERSLGKLVEEQERRLREQGQTWEDAKSTPEAFKKQNRAQVEKQWRANLALREIARLEGVEVKEEDLNEELSRLARETRQPPQAIREYLNRTRRWEELEERVRDDRTFARILASARITEQ